MTGSAKPSTLEVQRVANLLDRTISQLVKSLSTAPPIGTYEADVESSNLLKLIVRHVEGVVALARNDLVLLPPAMVIARAAFESAAKAMWILAPEDPFKREVRWLAHLQSEEEFHRKIAAQFSKAGADVSRVRDVEATIRGFRTQVTAMLPEGYTPLKKVPSVPEMLESLGESRKYLLYIWGCQYAHGTHAATGLYRKNLGTHKTFGEFISLDDWKHCLSVCWLSLSGPGSLFLKRAGGDSGAFLSTEFSETVKAAIEDIHD